MSPQAPQTVLADHWCRPVLPASLFPLPLTCSVPSPNPHAAGPAVYPESGGRARLLLAPDTPRVRGLARALARTLACPRDPAKRTCPVPNLPPNFHCMFMPPPQPKPQPPQPAQTVAHAEVAAGAVGEGLVGGVLQHEEKPVEGARAREWRATGGTQRFLGWGWGLPWSGGAQSTNGLERGTEEPQLGAADADPCMNFDMCMSTPACYEHVLRDQIVFMASEEVRHGGFHSRVWYNDASCCGVIRTTMRRAVAMRVTSGDGRTT